MGLENSQASGRIQKSNPVGYLCEYAEVQLAVAPVRSAEEIAATISILGLPKNEVTPRIRDAITELMAEADSLRYLLRQTQAELAQLEQAAGTDPRRPIRNRRTFVRELSRQIGCSARYGTPASLIYFALEGFQDLNDRCGELAGAVVAQFAETLVGHVRVSDIVGRLGGNEFGVILLHAGQEAAHNKAGALAKMLAAAPVHWNKEDIRIGFTYGALELIPGTSAEDIMAQADDVMTTHKGGVQQSEPQESSPSG
ncbi:MAG: GGDEF domain-containing protein [Alphaproteobacteria bacterium]|nr:GGDEF domain-containing protein [Alphaproteobacteria bacterium]